MQTPIAQAASRELERDACTRNPSPIPDSRRRTGSRPQQARDILGAARESEPQSDVEACILGPRAQSSRMRSIRRKGSAAPHNN
jgi:hypothetical protein